MNSAHWDLFKKDLFGSIGKHFPGCTYKFTNIWAKLADLARGWWQMRRKMSTYISTSRNNFILQFEIAWEPPWWVVPENAIKRWNWHIRTCYVAVRVCTRGKLVLCLLGKASAPNESSFSSRGLLGGPTFHTQLSSYNLAGKCPININLFLGESPWWDLSFGTLFMTIGQKAAALYFFSRHWRQPFKLTLLDSSDTTVSHWSSSSKISNTSSNTRFQRHQQHSLFCLSLHTIFSFHSRPHVQRRSVVPFLFLPILHKMHFTSFTDDHDANGDILYPRRRNDNWFPLPSSFRRWWACYPLEGKIFRIQPDGCTCWKCLETSSQIFPIQPVDHDSQGWRKFKVVLSTG